MMFKELTVLRIEVSAGALMYETTIRRATDV
jgi:hypothetical protein